MLYSIYVLLFSLYILLVLFNLCIVCFFFSHSLVMFPSFSLSFHFPSVLYQFFITILSLCCLSLRSVPLALTVACLSFFPQTYPSFQMPFLYLCFSFFPMLFFPRIPPLSVLSPIFSQSLLCYFSSFHYLFAFYLFIYHLSLSLHLCV